MLSFPVQISVCSIARGVQKSGFYPKSLLKSNFTQLNDTRAQYNIF